MGMGRRNELGPRLIEAVGKGIKKRIQQVMGKPRTQVKDLTPPKPKPTPKPIPGKPFAENTNQRNARLDKTRRLNEQNRQANANTAKENKTIREANRKKVEGNQAARGAVNKARTQLAGATVLGAGLGISYATGDKPKAAPVSTSKAPQARQAITPVKEAHPRIADFTIRAAPKKPGILSRVATSLKSKVSGKPSSKSISKPSTSKVSTGKKSISSSNRSAQNKRMNRKSDSRLGSFSSRTSSRASDVRSTPRAEVDYSAPMWTGNTPTNMASYGKATKAPAPKVRAEVKASKPKVVTPKPKVVTPKPTSHSNGKTDTRGGSNILGSVKNFYAKTYNLPQTPSKPKTQTVTKRKSRTGGKPDTRGAYGPLKAAKAWYKKTYNL
tara:strand:- start:332 stop:1480 length:1149 start_codon:yes stop_codon:yes gene_type:complete